MEDNGTHVISGLIVRRRCCGKHLSFANIRQSMHHNHDEQGVEDGSSIIRDAVTGADTPGETDHNDTKVVFRRAYFQGDNFPLKSSDLPYGAHVSMTVCCATPLHNNKDDAASSSVILLLWQVTSWHMVEEDPKEQALRMAKTGDGGVMCSTYLQLRADAYFHLNQKQQDRLRPRMSTATTSVGDEISCLTTFSLSIPPHGNPRAKGLRAKIFCDWLMEHVLVADQQEKVLDVAGGKGQLAMELLSSSSSSAFRISCTVMDPLIRKTPTRRLRRSCLDQNGVMNLNYLHSSFSQNEETSLLLDQYTCLVGMHPDECTEDILDMALRANKKVAIIPCCVFPSFFPLRTLRDGRFVTSYDDFLRYLLEKDVRLQQATLPFDGRNQVIFLS